MYFDRKVVIVAAKRTPIGKFCSALSSIPAHKFGAEVIRQAIVDAKLTSKDITELIFGQVLTAGTGQNPARIASVLAGIGFNVPACSINQVCGSGLKSVIIAAYKIFADNNQIIVAGGQENMSMAPHIVHLRNGIKMGEGRLVDSMMLDGLTDAFNNYLMGITAENLADKYKIYRREQDEFSYASQHKTEIAQQNGAFKNEIVPIKIKDKLLETDEQPRNGITVESLEKLKPAFKENGTVTAGNSSTINDGAASVILMHESEAKKRNMEVLAKIVSSAESGLDPSIMGIAPVEAVKNALIKANWQIADLDAIEVNEAFAAQSIAVIKELGLDKNKVNVNGGAIALGHPIGASGARCLVTLVHHMRNKNLKRGLVSLCIGGGMGIAMCIER